MNGNVKVFNGNEAAAYISYPFTEVAAIYPITPSSPMAEITDKWAAHGKTNMFGNPVKVVELQSEGGAAGTLHGSLASGALTTTYTASQGLLLMIPNMYKLTGELLPAVFHVSARALATHALSIFGDHQDVMACRQTGFGLLASSNAQEVMDLGGIAHLAAITSRWPILHFFDGFRTSHEYQKISLIDFDDIENLVDYQAIETFRRRALRPEQPVVRGTAQNPDIYFQGRELANPFIDKLPDTISYYMDELGKITGRQYSLFDYHGDPEAEYVLIAMGSVCDTIEETVNYLNNLGWKTGLIKVRLFRPFDTNRFLNTIPNSVRKIGVLDRTKEPGSQGEPLYQDVVHAVNHMPEPIDILGGRYGLGSKETRPSHIISVFENLADQNPKNNFTIGIVDDISHSSLPETKNVDITPEDTISCKFWGLGSDGTVGANQSAVKIIGEQTDMYAQAYFSYDSKKSGGTTISHLRFGNKPIKAPYFIYKADYIACHNPAFVNNYDLLQGLKKSGTFVLNCPWDKQELEDKLPANMKRFLAENEINFYIIDAISIAGEIGLGNRINMIMQAAFFKLAEVIPLEEAAKHLKVSVKANYGDKGEQVVEMNNQAIDRGIDSLVPVEIPDSWKNAQETEDEKTQQETPEFIKNIQKPMAKHEGDDLPVGAFSGMEDGAFPLGVTAYEKRGIAVTIPEWQIDNCIQCNQCAFICPHAVIRPFLLSEQENEQSPEGFDTKEAKGKGLDEFYYRIQVSPLDCTGCGNCADICPAKEKALIMKPAEEQIEDQEDNWEFATTISDKSQNINTENLKGSQFIPPLFEFHGACPGCGETPYYRLLTQLFGERMLIANATGCSSIYCGSAPAIPFTTTESGRGPAWANSLFEDNAEYGYGMFLAADHIQDYLADTAQQFIDQSKRQSDHDQLKKALQEWLQVRKDGDNSLKAAESVIKELSKIDDFDNEHLQILWNNKDFLTKRSQWIIGGDGWAYDIGFGGLDHVLASGADVNALVMDTEVYSNTGGQSSKATQAGTVAKFAASGKDTVKKDLALMMMTYGYVYVAQISMGANMNHTLKVMLEAERYPGPSLVIAYSPCINHGIKTGMGTSISQEKFAVDSGYWHLFRYNPELKNQGENSFILDSSEPKESIRDFLNSEVRFTALAKTFPEEAEEFYQQIEEQTRKKHHQYKMLAQEQIF